MTYKIYFIERTRAQLCHSIHATSDEVVKNLIVVNGEARGFEVRVEVEH